MTQLNAKMERYISDKILGVLPYIYRNTHTNEVTLLEPCIAHLKDCHGHGVQT